MLKFMDLLELFSLTPGLWLQIPTLKGHQSSLSTHGTKSSAPTSPSSLKASVFLKETARAVPHQLSCKSGPICPHWKPFLCSPSSIEQSQSSLIHPSRPSRLGSVSPPASLQCTPPPQSFHLWAPDRLNPSISNRHQVASSLQSTGLTDLSCPRNE